MVVSQNARHTDHGNEIVSNIEELYDAGVIKENATEFESVFRKRVLTNSSVTAKHKSLNLFVVLRGKALALPQTEIMLYKVRKYIMLVS